MRVSRLMHVVRHPAPLAAAALVLSAPLAAAQPGRSHPAQRARSRSAQARTLFEWTGSVDREKQIIMRGNRIWTRDVGRTEPRADRARRYASIPRRSGHIVLRVLDGRGDVRVIQQPSARNRYTTIVRVMDPRGGADRYRLAAYWQGYEYANEGIARRGRSDSHRSIGRGPWRRP